MIYFIYKPRSKTNLVSIRAVPCRSSGSNLSLRKLAFKRISQRYGRVGRTGNTHRLIHVTPSRKRVPYRSAKTCCGASERFYFRRMVVGLIFEKYKPLLGFSVYLNRNYNRACVNLVRHFHVVKLSVFPQFLHSHEGYIHKRDIFITASFIELLKIVRILFIGCFDWLSVITVLKAYIFKLGKKSSVAAVV